MAKSSYGGGRRVGTVNEIWEKVVSDVGFEMTKAIPTEENTKDRQAGIHFPDLQYP